MALDPGRTGFLDLSAEIRNRIYEETLTHNRRTSQLANTALLRVCKQINQEATGLFHARSTFTITAECHLPAASSDSFEDREEPLPLTVYGDIFVPSTVESTPSTFASVFPNALENVLSIDVMVIMPLTSIKPDNYKILHHFLYGFSSFVTSEPPKAGRAVSVAVVDNETHFTGAYWQKKVLCPLAKLSPPTTLLLKGLSKDAEHSIHGLRAHESAHELQCNSIRTWKQIEASVKCRLSDAIELDRLPYSKEGLMLAAHRVTKFLETSSQWIQPYSDQYVHRNLALLHKWTDLRNESVQSQKLSLETELSRFQCEFHKFETFKIF